MNPEDHRGTRNARGKDEFWKTRMKGVQRLTTLGIILVCLGYWPTGCGGQEMAGFFSEKGIVFFPDPVLIGTPADYGLDYEEVWFEAEDGIRLHGWWLPRPGAPTLIWLHGNGGNISHRIEGLKLLHDLSEVQIFIFDYREYGKSQGKIDREGTFKDTAAAYRYVTETRRVPPSEVVLFGRSLGSALAVDLAVREPSRCLIIGSSFTSSDDMAKILIPFIPFMRDWRPSIPYDNLGKIGRVKVPVLIVHGDQDEIIPVEMGRRLFAAASDPKELYIIPGGHHNDTFFVGGKPYFDKLRQFIKESE